MTKGGQNNTGRINTLQVAVARATLQKQQPPPWIQHIFPAAAAKWLQSCPTLRPQRRQPTRLPGPWDSPGKNTGMGCYFLLQCMKVKNESEVVQSCLTPSDPMDCSLPGSSVHGICQARVLEWGAIFPVSLQMPEGAPLIIPSISQVLSFQWVLNRYCWLNECVNYVLSRSEFCQVFLLLKIALEYDYYSLSEKYIV